MFREVLTIPSLTAADDDGVAQSQSIGAAGNVNLNGALVTGGVAVFDAPRRVLFTFAADETGHNFTVYGTDRYGRPAVQVVAGTATVAFTTEDFATVTRVAVSAASTGNFKIGTSAIATSKPHIADTFTNPSKYSYSIDKAGTSAPIIEVCWDNLAPAWDFANNTVTWKENGNSAFGVIEGPFTAIRLKNASGVGACSLTIITPFIAGGV